ncbi:MAG TPA: hypothetical protein VLQ48_01870 [Chloroflexia bacterium]|nr:hypothetical protein [Chloroflexia bacterium]
MRTHGNSHQWRKWTAILIVGGLTISMALIYLSLTSTKGGNLSAIMPDTQGANFHYGTESLVGASPDEVGQYALEYVQHHLEVSGEPQVVLARFITQAERPSLGLGCPQAKLTIEDPPEILVILSGDFDVSKAISGLATKPPWHFKYVAYIFDLWSASHTTFIYSRNGAQFRTALNDPTIPSDGPNAEASPICPTPLPDQVLLHYGDIAPTIQIPEGPAVGSPTPVSPIPSEIVPPPLPTYGSK